LAVAVDANLIVVAIASAFAAVFVVRLEIHAADIGTAVGISWVTHALPRNALIVAFVAALTAIRGIRRQITATFVGIGPTLRLARHALTLPGNTRARTTVHVTHSTTVRIRRQIAASKLIAAIDLAIRALASPRDARACAAIDVALAAVFRIIRHVEAALIAFERSCGAGATLSGYAILPYLARFVARTAMRGIARQVETAIDA
jgi:hypothetical protein